MNIVTPMNELEYVDRMVAIALEGKLSVYFAEDTRDFDRIKAMLEKHLDTIAERLPETHIYWANGRYVIDNSGRKGYVLITNRTQELEGIHVTEVFAHYGVVDSVLNFLASRERNDVVGGKYDRSLRW